MRRRAHWIFWNLWSLWSDWQRERGIRRRRRLSRHRSALVIRKEAPRNEVNGKQSGPIKGEVAEQTDLALEQLKAVSSEVKSVLTTARKASMQAWMD
jgi:hypothetical protein